VGKKSREVLDSLDEEGFATITSELSASRRRFTIDIESSVPMEWYEALLALSSWLEDEAKKLGD